MGSKKDLPQTLRVEAGYYFESLRNAQRALKNDHKLRRGWSKEKIIAALSRMWSKDRYLCERPTPFRIYRKRNIRVKAASQAP